MDGIEALVNVTVVGATNRPDCLDSALLRPGRLDRILRVSPPDVGSRLDILRMKLRVVGGDGGGDDGEDGSGCMGDGRMACDAGVDLTRLAEMVRKNKQTPKALSVHLLRCICMCVLTVF